MKIKEDATVVTFILSQMQKLCHEAEQLSKERRCKHWTHHLQEKSKQFEWLTEVLDGIINDGHQK